MTVEQAPPPPGLVYILGWWREVSTAPLMSAVVLTARPRAQTGVAHIADDAGNVMYGVGVSAATDPEGRALLTLVWVEGAVYDVEFGGVKGTLRCDDWPEGSTVPFTGIRGLPGGDGIADPLTWDTVIAGLNGRIASQVPPVVATAVPAYLSAHPDIIEDAATAAGAAAGAAAVAAQADMRYTTIDVVADYGAPTNGGSSAVEAFESAIQAANARGGKVVIRIPPGIYDLQSGISTPITRNYTWFIGAGQGASTLLVRDGTLFKWGTGTGTVIGGGAAHLDISAPSTPDSNQRIIHIDGGSSQKFRYLMVDNVAQIARLGEPVGSGGYAAAPTLCHISGNTAPLAGVAAIDARRGFSLTLRDVIVSANGVGFPTGRTELHPAPVGSTFLRLGAGSWDTAHVSMVTTNRYDIGLDVYITNVSVVSNMWFYGCVFDYSKSRGIRLRASANGAYIGSLMFIGGWAVATDGYSVEVVGTSSGGVIENIDFTNVTAQQAGKSNWRFSAAYYFDAIRLLNCRSHSGNRLLGNSFYDACDVAILAHGVDVRGGRFGDPHIAGDYQPDYGIGIDTNREVSVTGVTAKGALGGFSVATYTAADTRSLITGNRVDTATGRPDYTAGSGTMSTPTSGATTTHVHPWRETLYIYGGSISEVRLNAIQVTTATPTSLDLNPGDTWSVTYTTAPTIKRIIAP